MKPGDDNPLVDSVELKAARETVTNCDCPCAEAGQALLRMVDDMAEDLDGLPQLNAQLAEANALAYRAGRHAIECQHKAVALERRVSELEELVLTYKPFYDEYCR